MLWIARYFTLQVTPGYVVMESLKSINFHIINILFIIKICNYNAMLNYRIYILNLAENCTRILLKTELKKCNKRTIMKGNWRIVNKVCNKYVQTFNLMINLWFNITTLSYDSRYNLWESRVFILRNFIHL